MIRSLIDDEREFAFRRIRAAVHNELMIKVNLEALCWINRENSWQLRKKPQGQRPSAKGLRPVSIRLKLKR